MTTRLPLAARLKSLLPIILIVALAAALRLPGLGHDSLWGDEALSWLIARMSLPDLFQHVIWWEQIPPAHHLILWLWIKVFGASELSLRLPSALVGIAAVAAMYHFVRRLLGTREALSAALLLAVAPLHIAFAQEARTYALTFLVALICSDLFVRLLRGPATQRLQVAYVLTAALLLYCHLYGVFVIAAHQVAYGAALLRRSNHPATRLRRWIIMSVAIAALYSPWVPIVLGWVRAVNVNFWVKQVTLDDISRAYWVLTGSTPLFVIAIVLMVLGVVHVFRRHRETLPLLLALTLLPVLAPVVMSILGRPSFSPRYAIVACVGLYPLIAAGVAALPTAPVRVAVLIAIAVLGVMGLRGEATIILKPPWREAVAYVEANARDGDIAVVHIKAKTRLYDYYARRPQLPRRGFDSESLPLVPPLDAGRHIWFIRHEEWATLPAQLRRGPWHVISHKWFGDILVMELDDAVPPPEPTATTSPSSTSPAR